MRRLALLGAALLVVGLACGRPPPTPAERARAIEAEVWSPYCPGRLLVDCTTAQAQELRADILERIERGDATSDVIDWMRAEFGDEAIARPVARGAFVIWLVPVLIFLIGAVIVVRVVRRGRVATGASGNA